VLDLRERRDLRNASLAEKESAWNRIREVARSAQLDAALRGDLDPSRFNVLFRYLAESDLNDLDFYAFEVHETVITRAATVCFLLLSFSDGKSRLKYPVAVKYKNEGPDMILAIDDDEDRYDELKRLLAGTNVELVIACCPESVKQHLSRAELRGILLDYDLDICCDKHKDLKGSDYISDVIQARVPVVVVSANRTGGHWLYATLTKDATTPVYYAPASDTYSPEYVWLGWLWREGALI
jgi:hypothetical protein